MPAERIEPLFNTPCDWDGVRYCADGCGQPATHRRLDGMVGDTPLYEIVCCTHAQEAQQ